MPLVYKKKADSTRAKWTEEQLKAALQDIGANKLSIRKASKIYHIPDTTLRRHLKGNNDKKSALGSPSCLGEQNELKLVIHIKKLQAHGFAPTRTEVCRMAYQLAERYQIKHKFNHEQMRAGYGWLFLFMKRHPELSIRKSEGVSQARAEGMDREKISTYFNLLEKVLAENGLMDKPGHIYNMDETGCQLNNRPDHVIAERGSKNVVALTSAEKGETVTVIACCNAEGNFLPPACVFKGKNKKAEFEDGMPPGSVVYMGEKSAYVNTSIFFIWLKEHFVPRKPQGTVLLILDGHSSHCSNIEMLEYAAKNEIILLCLPPHSTQFLQPLDRAYFKSFKSHFYEACKLFVKTHPGRKINRLQFGNLLSAAWCKSATASNGVSAFSATGIYPFNPAIIPDYAFIRMNSAAISSKEPQIEDTLAPQLPRQPPITPPLHVEKQSEMPEPSLSEDVSDITPGKVLNLISPIPSTLTSRKTTSRKIQVARILTSQENITKQKARLSSKRERQQKKPKKAFPKRRKKTNVPTSLSSSDEENTVEYADESDGSEDFGEDLCAGCGEEYTKTQKRDDWVECIICKMWSHDTCTSYVNTCNACGNKNLKKQ